MVGMTLLSIGVLGAVGLQATTIGANRYGSHATQAVVLAQSKLQELMQYPMSPFIDAHLWNSNSGNDPTPFGQPFVSAAATSIDPTPQADAAEANMLDEFGKSKGTPMIAGGPGFQRYWQIAPYALNPNIAGTSALLIRVCVRFNDSLKTLSYREVCVSGVRTINL